MIKTDLHRIVFSLALLAGSAFSLACQTPPATTQPAQASAPPASTQPSQPGAPPATQPKKPREPFKQPADLAVPRAEQWWLDRHNRMLQFKRIAPVDLIFIGDSITQGWDDTGAKVWDTHYARRQALNLGFSGDRTQNVLFRVKHNEVEELSPHAVVLMIGTNNSNGDDYTAEEIAGGIKAIVALLRERLPSSKVLLLAIFPRGEQPNPQREKNAKASELASTVADGKMVFYMDIGSKFMNADGSISKEIMPDFLHLSTKGYEIWADAIEDKLKELMTDHPASQPAPKTP